MKNNKYIDALMFLKKKHHKETLLDRLVIVVGVSFAVFIISAAFFLESNLENTGLINFNNNISKSINQGFDFVGRLGFVLIGLIVLIKMRMYSNSANYFSSEAWSELTTSNFASFVGQEVLEEITLVLLNKESVFSDETVFNAINSLQEDQNQEPISLADQLKNCKKETA